MHTILQFLFSIVLFTHLSNFALYFSSSSVQRIEKHSRKKRTWQMYIPTLCQYQHKTTLNEISEWWKRILRPEWMDDFFSLLLFCSPSIFFLFCLLLFLHFFGLKLDKMYNCMFSRLINSEIIADPLKPHNHKTDYSMYACNRFKKKKKLKAID